jgi:predicted permease
VTWWRRLLGQRRLERELDAELRFHLDRQVADNIRQGVSEREARRQATLLFGGIDQTKEACRDARGTRWLTALGRDVVSAARSLRATPGFSAVAIAVLTLGIGASTAIFSVVDAVVLRGLPFDEGDRLVAIRELGRSGRPNLASPQNYADWKASSGDIFTGLAAIAWGNLDIKREGALAPETLRGKRVTAELFSILRVSSLKGRTFSADDEVEGRDAVAVIGYGLWQRRFGGDPDVIGKRLPAADRSFEIIGVMPRGFDYPPGAVEPTEVWTPYVIPADQRMRPGNGRYWTLNLVGRLRDGVSVDHAQRKLDETTKAMMAADPNWFSGMTGVLVQPLRDSLTGDTRRWMFLLLGAVSFVLLLACVNVANLLLVRATTRMRELAVRAALGATRADLVRALLAESVILSCAGAVLGVFLAWWGVDVLRGAIPDTVPRLATVAVNLRVLAVATAAAVTTGLVFGLVPAIPFSRPVLTDAIKDGGRTLTAGASRQWLRTLLVVSEVALAVVLLVGSGLFLSSFSRVTHVDLGMNIEHVLTVQITLPPDAPRKRARILDVLDRVSGIGGVDAVAVTGTAVPLCCGRISHPVRLPKRPGIDDSAGIDQRDVSPDYFRVLQVPLVAGRFFTADDRRDGPAVVILNQAAAKRYYGDAASAIGQQVEVESEHVREVVGVVGDVRQFGPEQSANLAFFVPFAQGDAWGTLVLRVSRDTAPVLSAVKTVVWNEFPDAVIPDAYTLRDYLDIRLAARRFNMLLLGLFGALGLVIAALGIYGVMAYVVTQRTHEIGIRMALGATPWKMLTSVLGRAFAVVAIGLSVGLAGAWQLSAVAKSFLFEVQPHDAGIYAGVALVLSAAGLAAAFIPARRAARVDPLVALRMD